jgi:hypothetical protein
MLIVLWYLRNKSLSPGNQKNSKGNQKLKAIFLAFYRLSGHPNSTSYFLPRDAVKKSRRLPTGAHSTQPEVEQLHFPVSIEIIFFWHDFSTPERRAEVVIGIEVIAVHYEPPAIYIILLQP